MVEVALKFYLGLFSKAQVRKCNVPFCYSWRRLRLDGTREDGLEGDWILDSGAFSELALEGKYTVSIDEYVKAIESFMPPIAVVMDWMCEPNIRAKTGLTVKEHQKRTLANWLELSSKLNGNTTELMPVIQGWETSEYLGHVDEYLKCGCREDSYFGVGSICRRGNQTETKRIVKILHSELPRARLHAFGLNTNTFSDSGIVHSLKSADSMAWSLRGWRLAKHEGKPCGESCIYPARKNCATCWKFALIWRDKVISRIEQARLQQIMTL